MSEMHEDLCYGTRQHCSYIMHCSQAAGRSGLRICLMLLTAETLLQSATVCSQSTLCFGSIMWPCAQSSTTSHLLSLLTAKPVQPHQLTLAMWLSHPLAHFSCCCFYSKCTSCVSACRSPIPSLTLLGQQRPPS